MIYKNRGVFLDIMLREDIFKYPLGAGAGRWGMMCVYFGDPAQSLWAEIMWQALLFDGGIPLVLLYIWLLSVLLFTAWRIALRARDPELSCWAAVTFAFTLGTIAASFVYPIYIKPAAIDMFVLNACLYAVAVGEPSARTVRRMRNVIPIEPEAVSELAGEVALTFSSGVIGADASSDRRVGCSKIRSADYPALDAWRGIASLAVVAYHAGLVIVDRRFDGRSPSIVYAITNVGYLGVTLFFVISGYCIAAAAESALQTGGRGLKGFAVARVRRIFPPYWAAMMLTIALAMVAAALAARGVLHGSASASADGWPRSITFWLTNLTLTQPYARQAFIVGVSWTLAYECAFYLLIAIAMFAAQIVQRCDVVWILAHTFTAFVCGAMIARIHLPFPIDLWPQFGMGVYVYDLIRHGRTGRTIVGGATIAILAIGVLLLRSPDVGLMGQSIYFPFGTACVFSILLLLARPRSTPQTTAREGWLGRLGLISYSLYLTHFAVLGLVNQFARRWIALQFHLLQLTLSIVACVLFAGVFWYVAERPFAPRRSRMMLATSAQPAFASEAIA